MGTLANTSLERDSAIYIGIPIEELTAHYGEPDVVIEKYYF